MTAALEDVKTINIEEWKTLNTASSPTKLELGQTPKASNVWVDEKPGSVITSNGFKKVGSIPSGNPVTFCIDYFKTSAGTQTFVVSDNTTVWTTTDFQAFSAVITGLSGFFQIRGAVIRDKLWLTNGSDSVRVFDGSTVQILDGTGGTPNVPKGRYIAYHDERVWVYHDPSNRSRASFSALTDSSGTVIDPDNVSAWPTSNTLQISQGDADFGTGIILYRGYLYFFKQYSIWRLVGYDEYTYSRVKTRASTGTRFNESIQVLDNLVHLIGVDGLYVFDGEETARISDIIDPSVASQASFGFNQLQQPNLNEQFWEVTSTADWNAGTVLRNAAINNSLALGPVDTTQTDFAAGVTLSNIDFTTNPGSIQLSTGATGGSSIRVGPYVNAYLDDGGNGDFVYGDPFFLTDADTTRFTGFGIQRNQSAPRRMVVDLDKNRPLGRVILRGVQADTDTTASVQVNTGTYQTKGGVQGTWVTVGTFHFRPGAAWVPVDITFDFALQNAIQVSIFLGSPHTGSYQMSEIEMYQVAFNLTGKFTSQKFDFNDIPNTFQYFNADFSANGETITFFTQSSSDGTNWDAEVPVVLNGPTNALPGGTPGSTVRRFLRWGCNMTSDGLNSPIVNAAFFNLLYESAIHDTGGNIFGWTAFEADVQNNGGGVNFYYRGGVSTADLQSKSWTFIVPVAAINLPVNNRYIQFKIEIVSGNTGRIPVVNSVTVNWIVGSAQQVQTLQNVASYFWRNRYWLAAASSGATANDTVLIRGKKTFGSPWQLKDWNLLSFTRYHDNLYGGSSKDGSIFQLDTGYSKDGSAIDSYFESGDFTFGGFSVNVTEVLIEVERMGPYNLTVGISIDRGNTFTEFTVDLTPSTFAPSYVKRLNFNLTCERFRVRVRINDVDKPFQVHRLAVYYKMSAARGSIK